MAYTHMSPSAASATEAGRKKKKKNKQQELEVWIPICVLHSDR